MPGLGVHLLIARRVLELAPPSDHVSRQAFLLGAIAPDMGYFPGSDQFTSDLAHYATPATLTRNLLGLAREEVSRQFARGWATHVLADHLIHPLINSAAGELTGAATSRTFADDPVSHIRVEQGLDATATARIARPAPPRLSAEVLQTASALLTAAYKKTYGVVAPSLRLGVSIRAAASFCPLLLAYGRLVGWWLGQTSKVERPWLLLACGFGLARALSRLSPRALLFGLVHPIAPRGWLFAATADLITTIPARFAEHEATGFTMLPESNLDTGELDHSPPSYLPAKRTLDELHRRCTTSLAAVSRRSLRGHTKS